MKTIYALAGAVTAVVIGLLLAATPDPTVLNVPAVHFTGDTATTNLTAVGGVLKYGGGTVGGGVGGFAGAVSNNVASAGLLAVDATKTNGVAATSAMVTNTIGSGGIASYLLASGAAAANLGYNVNDSTTTIFAETFASSSALTNFIVHGACTASVSGGNLVLTNMSADADYISRSNYVTSLEDWQMTVIFDVPSSRPTTCYVFPSVIGSYAGYATKCGINVGTSQGGQLSVLDGNDVFLVASDTVSATNNLNISASDRIKLICERHKDAVTVYAYNITSGDARSISYQYANSTANFVHSLGVFAIGGNLGGKSISVEDWNVTTDTGTADILCIGDSITVGYAAAVSTDKRWADVLAMVSNLKVSVLAGPNNALKDMLVLTNEVAYFKPKIGLISAGINDLNQGRTTNQLQGDIGTMYTNLVSLGITPVVITPTPYHGGAGLRDMRNWITSTYPSNSIDTFTAMCGGTNGLYLQPLVDSGDGAHFNSLGHLVYGQLVARGLRDLGLMPKK